MSSNKLYQLDGLSDIIQMAPTVKILNLSKNEVRRGSQIKVGLRVGRGRVSGHQSDDRRQVKVPVGEGGRWGCREPDVPLSLGFLFPLPPHISQLTSVWELSKMQGLKLEELWLQGNPLCGTFPDQSTYVRSV